MRGPGLKRVKKKLQSSTRARKKQKRTGGTRQGALYEKPSCP